MISSDPTIVEETPGLCGGARLGKNSLDLLKLCWISN